jgi:hypothetical protein
MTVEDIMDLMLRQAYKTPTASGTAGTATGALLGTTVDD